MLTRRPWPAADCGRRDATRTLAAMLIGLLSDTHQPYDGKALWDEVVTAFAGVDLVIHAGDIVHPLVLDRLEEVAPVLAAWGNNDAGWTDPRMRDVQLLDVEGRRVAVIHDMEPEERPIGQLCDWYLKGERPDVIVTGHTHLERLDFREGVLQLNPGSPTLPHLQSMRLGTVGLLEISAGRIEARIVRIGETPGRPNPGIEYRFTPETGVERPG
jgi:putative phosphoesterase